MRKAQAEDVLADLVPSLFIIVLGIVLFGWLSTAHASAIETKESQYARILQHDTLDGLAYLRVPLFYQGRLMTMADLIVEAYPDGEPDDAQKQRFLQLQTQTFLGRMADTRWTLTLSYPNKEFTFYDIYFDAGSAQAFFLPLKDGGVVKVSLRLQRPQAAFQEARP